MRLRQRVARTVGWNLALFLVPWFLFHAARAIALWGAYRGYWEVYYV